MIDWYALSKWELAAIYLVGFGAVMAVIGFMAWLQGRADNRRLQRKSRHHEYVHKP